MKYNGISETSNLRLKAEELLKVTSPDFPFNSEINNLKLIHELEVHQIELQLQNEELRIANEFVKEVAEKFTDLFELAPKFSAKNEITTIADIKMLKTILRNLISNAIKFTKQNGTVSISAIQDKSQLIFSVSDNGIGIEPDRLKSLFDITRYSTTYGTANEIGNGLGLLLCNAFIEKHGGKIWAESEIGKGSTFYFSIPSK